MRRLAPLAAGVGLAALAGPAMADVRYRTTTPNGERLTVFARTRGRKVGPRRWVGRFGARIVARRRGRVLDRCSVRGVRWRVVRPAA